MGCTRSGSLCFDKVLGDFFNVNNKIFRGFIPAEVEPLDDWTQQFVGLQ